MTVGLVTKTESVLLDYLDHLSGWSPSLRDGPPLMPPTPSSGRRIHHLPVLLVNPSLFPSLPFNGTIWGIQSEPWLRAYGQVCGFIIPSQWRAFKAQKRTNPALNLTNKALLNKVSRPCLVLRRGIFIDLKHPINVFPLDLSFVSFSWVQDDILLFSINVPWLSSVYLRDGEPRAEPNRRAMTVILSVKTDLQDRKPEIEYNGVAGCLNLHLLLSFHWAWAPVGPHVSGFPVSRCGHWTKLWPMGCEQKGWVQFPCHEPLKKGECVPLSLSILPHGKLTGWRITLEHALKNNASGMVKEQDKILGLHIYGTISTTNCLFLVNLMKVRLTSIFLS